jgi:DNA-binding FrmR family transcriptional regulator
MTTQEPDAGRICREVQTQLPAALAETLPGWRRRLVGRHLRRCVRCEAELERQRDVTAGLGELGAAAAADGPDAPPEELLSALLERAERPGMRERAAVPARGAVSGARPALSVALLVAAAVTGTAVGFAAWRGLRAMRRLLGRPGT